MVDRDALLHLYTVALACRWLVGPLTCGDGPGGGVVSKRVHGNDGVNDTVNDGVNAIEPPSPEMRRKRPDDLRDYRVSRA